MEFMYGLAAPLQPIRNYLRNKRRTAPESHYKRLFPIGHLCYQSAKFMSTHGIQTHALQIKGLGALTS